MARLSAEQKEIVVARLLSVRTAGLEIRPIAARTLVKYAGSLVGRDFRVIAQVAPFALHGLVPKECFETWVALSTLIPMIWQPVIDNLGQYLVSCHAPSEDVHFVFLLTQLRLYRSTSERVLITSFSLLHSGLPDGSTNRNSI